MEKRKALYARLRPAAGIITILATALGSGAPAAGQSFEELVKASEPLAPAPSKKVVAGRTLTAELCKIKGAEFLGKSASSVLKAVAVVGDRVLLAGSDGVIVGLKGAEGKECSLALDPDFGEGGHLKLKHAVESLSSDRNGRVIASHGIFAIYGIQDGKEQFSCDTSGLVRVHASGSWGIGSRANSSVKVIDFGKFNCKKVEDWVLKDLGNDEKRQGPFTNVNATGFVGDNVLVGGILAASVDPKSPRVVVAYDRAGTEKFRFGNTKDSFAEDRFGWVHAIQPCGDGVCVLDGNNKRLTLWGADGEFYGSVDLKELFGLKSPWLNDFAVTGAGQAYVIAGQDRTGGKVAEGLLFRIQGL